MYKFSITSIAQILLLVGVSMVMAQGTNTTCDLGYWGEGCVNYCGYCYSDDSIGYYERKCNPGNGACSEGCQGGWTGTNCDEPLCEGGCNGGQCLSPGYCGNCPDISHVNPGCTNIKLRGLLGSLMAFAVLIFSLISCAIGSVMYERRKNTAVAL